MEGDAVGPNPKLVELSELLVGTWRVDGPDISGVAKYQTRNEGRLLVAYVDFSVGGTKMRVIQHITHHPDTDALLARYMDTMGDEATYRWALEDGKIRVSLGEEDSDTYFQATLNDDNSQYVGTWHYPEGGPTDEAETIVYTRVQDTDQERPISRGAIEGRPSPLARMRMTKASGRSGAVPQR
jgi:hypothetical protein